MTAHHNSATSGRHPFRKRLGFVAGLFIAAMAVNSDAYARSDLRTMTCSQAQEYVKLHNGTVATYDIYKFARFVNSGRFCNSDEHAVSKWIATKDNQKCRINYVCERRMDD